MTRAALLLYVFLCIHSFVSAQPPLSPASIDSLKQAVKMHTKADRTRVDLLTRLAQATRRQDHESANDLVAEAREISQKIGYTLGLANVYDFFANAAMQKQNPEDAILFFQKALPLYKQEKKLQEEGRCYYGLGNMYSALTKNREALDYYVRALRISEQLKEFRDTGPIYNNIGRIYHTTNQPGKALENYRKARDIAEQNNIHGLAIISNNNISVFYTNKEELEDAENFLLRMLQKPLDKALQAQVHQSLGITYSKMQQYDKGLHYHTKALEHALQIRQLPQQGTAYSNIASVYLMKNMPDTAEVYANRSLKIAEQTNSSGTIVFQKLLLARIYKQQGKTAQAIQLYEDNIPKIDLSKMSGAVSQYNDLAALYQQLGDSAGMYRSQLRQALIKDSIGNIETKKQLSDIHIKYETEKKEQEIALLNKDKILQEAILQQQQLTLDAERKENELALLNSDNALQTVRLSEQAAQLEGEQKTIALSKLKAEKDLADKERLLQSSQLKQQKTFTYSMIALAISLVIIAGILFNRYRIKQKANSILNEKNEKIETLIRELHHRVKNNMQVVSSLLNLQSIGLTDSEAKAAVQEGQQRVEAMGLIHQKLYLNDDATKVDMKEYVEGLVLNLINCYQPTGKKIKLNATISPIQLDVDTAVPLGLIANELITNSIKHAFADNPAPSLDICLMKKDEAAILFSVKDNGPGIQPFKDADQKRSFGLQLVNTLTRQLKGSLQINNQQGMEYILTLPVLNTKLS